MNILLFIDDYSNDSGVNYDIKYSAKNIENFSDNKVFFISHNDKHEDKYENILKIGNLSILKKFKIVKKFISDNNIQIAHIRGVGLGSYNHLLSFLFCLFSATNFVVTTFSQINSFALKNKMFFENPDVKLMSQTDQKLFFLKKISIKIKSIVVPKLKYIYFHVISKYLLKKASCLLFFSKFEKKEVEKVLKLNEKKFVIIAEPILNLSKLEKIKLEALKSKGFYNDYWANQKFINIIYWGRIDYEIKGLDRIIESFKKYLKLNSDSKIRIHFMGPNYNNGLKKLKKNILINKLEAFLKVHEAEVWKGNFKPFVHADFSILPTYVDGFPRALRESLAFEVPIISSTESNFDDIILKFNCGLSFFKNEDLISVFKKIEKIPNLYKNLKLNCLLAINQSLSDEVLTKKLIGIYEEYSG